MSVKTERDRVIEEGKLNLENDETSIGLSNPIPLQTKEIKVDTLREVLIFEDAHSLDNQSFKSSVGYIYEEINKEDKFIEINLEREEKYTKTSADLKKYRKNFSSGKSKTQDAKKAVQAPKRNPKSLVSSSPFKLNVEERKALFEFFKSFDFLEQERLTLFKELKAVAEKDVSIPKSITRPSISTIKRQLERFGWDTRSEVQLKSNRYRVDKRAPDRTFGWESWDKNPFRLFLDSEAVFTSMVDSVDNAQKNYDNYMSGRRAGSVFGMFLGSNFQNWHFAEKNSYLKAIDDSKAAIDTTIAAKLLGWANQL